jgi:type VI secretion system protein ImpE
MTASDLFHAGRLRDAIDAQVAKVKSAPADNPARFFLFELFLFAGDLDRARKQLDVLRYDDPKHSAAVEQYRNALDAEARRRAVFAGNEHPKGLTAAPEHVRLRVEALPYLARGEYAEARKRLDAANAAVPAVKGTLNDLPIDGLYDADDRLGTVLEVFGTGGVYSWVPLESVASVTLNPPKSPRDVALRPAHVVLHDGLEGDVLLPGLYPGSHEHPDDAVRLGRATEWVTAGDGHRGAGGKLFLAGDNPVEFVKWQDLALERPT